MASKKELQEQLAEAQAQLAETQTRLADSETYATGLGEQYDALKVARDGLLVDNAAHRRRETERRNRDNAKERARRVEAEHKARRERLDQLGAGLLPIKGATSYAFIHERDGESGLEVFVPLDVEERRIVEGFLDARTQPKASQVTASVVDEINKMAQRFNVRQVFLTGQP